MACHMLARRPDGDRPRFRTSCDPGLHALRPDSVLPGGVAPCIRASRSSPRRTYGGAQLVSRSYMRRRSRSWVVGGSRAGSMPSNPAEYREPSRASRPGLPGTVLPGSGPIAVHFAVVAVQLPIKRSSWAARLLPEGPATARSSGTSPQRMDKPTAGRVCAACSLPAALTPVGPWRWPIRSGSGAVSGSATSGIRCDHEVQTAGEPGHQGCVGTLSVDPRRTACRENPG